LPHFYCTRASGFTILQHSRPASLQEHAPDCDVLDAVHQCSLSAPDHKQHVIIINASSAPQ